MAKSWLILGATSKIAQEVCRMAAPNAQQFVLVARNPERLAAVVGDLYARGAVKVEGVCADLADIDSHAALIGEIQSIASRFDVVVLAYGSLTDQKRAEDCPDYAISEIQTNFTSTVSLLLRLTDCINDTGKPCIAVISSVAGDRARRTNYCYGAAKGALSMFCDGLRSRFANSPVRVLTIKPGMVCTPMTDHVQRRALLADVQWVARKILKEIESGTRDVIYVPSIWRFIMFMVSHLPERITRTL